ncbi:MAG: GAF domain-containing protein, partial [Paracraurococcus sp.]
MTEAPSPASGQEATQRELAALRAEVARLGEALLAADRREAHGQDALMAERLRHENELTTARTEAATAWDRVASVSAELGRVLADNRSAALAVRESEADCRALFDARGDGSCIVEVLFDATGRAEDYRFLAVNAAFERQTGLRGAVGRCARELVPRLEVHWFETYGRVALTGETARFVNHAAPLGDRWYDVCAFRIGRPGQHRVAILFADITELRRAETALRESGARQALLLAVADALRPLADPAGIEGEACRLLAERLAVDRAYYVELDEAAATARVARDFVRGDAPSLAGQHRIADFAWSVAILRRGECHVIADTQASDLVPPADRPACAALGIIACMGAPLIKGGALVGTLCVTAARPRAWTRDEVELLREIGERVWASIERARAETRLREGEAWLAGEKEAFQAAASGAPLAVALAALIRTAAAQLGGAAGCAFYVADHEAAALRHVAGMSDAYADCVDGVRIGAESLACGLATHTGQPVITPDVTREPRWRPWLRMAEKRGYRGCWSFPIETLEGRVVGTFAAYFPTEREPTARDLDLAAVLVRAAAIIIARHQEAEERAQVEAALRASEERFRGFAENSADVLWIINGDGSRLDYLSPAFERIFGEPRARIMAELGRFMELVHPEDRGELSRYLPRALAGEVAVAHYRVVRPSDGRVVHLRDTGFPIRDANGAVVRAAGIVQDVSDLYEAAAEREAEKERFRTLAE